MKVLKQHSFIPLALCGLILLGGSHAFAGGFALNFTDLTSMWPIFKAFLILLGGIAAFLCFIGAGAKFLGRDWGEMIAFALAGFVIAYFVANAAGWINSESNAGI